MTTTEAKKTPRVRRDGLCYTCKKPRPENAVKIKDAFCSSSCARTYYGTALNSGS